MVKIIRTPSRYVQGKDALLEIKEHTENLGDSLFIITSKTAPNIKEKLLKEIYDHKLLRPVYKNKSP